MYYQISPTGYPIVSPIVLEGFIQYDEANKPQELIDALILQAQVDAEAESKQAKLLAMESITVTTASGKVFDGRDKDRARMNEAIVASGILGITETQWKLHDNTAPIITLDELKEALALSIQAVGAIVVGY